MDEEKIQRLMRLKRYEHPAENAVEDFIEEFRRRQRVELLHPSLWDIFRDQVALFIKEFQVPKMAYVTTTALAVMVALFIIRSDNFMGGITASGLNHPFSYKTSSSVQQSPSTTIMERIEPASMNINKDDRDEDSIVSPLSYILEKKHRLRGLPLSF